MAANEFKYHELVRRNAQCHAQAPALVWKGAAITHLELHGRVEALGTTLASCGAAPGAFIAVLASNRPQIIELLGAASLVGATLLLLNTRSNPAEIASLVHDAGARLVFADAALAPLLEQVPPGVVCHSFDEKRGRLLSWPEPAATANVQAHAEAAAPLLGIPTAATQGRPRIALVSHTALLHQALQLAHAWALTQNDRHLCMLPFFHLAGLGITVGVQVAGGASVVVERFDAPQCARLIESQRVSCFASFSPMLASLLDEVEHSSIRLDSLRAVTGLESPEAVRRLHEQRGRPIYWSGYGQTETTGLVSLGPYEEGEGRAGQPLPLVAMRIEGPDGSEAAAGEAGEIVVGGPFVFDGYLGASSGPARHRGQRWHRTGDLGRMDGQGSLWYLGRTADKRLIKSGGENIYPAEVEQALLQHPAVEAAVVFGVADAHWGEAVRAVCVRAPGTAATEDELIAHVASRIARFKKPRDVLFVPSLPKRADGSWDRDAVAALHAA